MADVPPRRRTSKRRAPLLGEDGVAFLLDDGVHPMFSRGPNDPAYTPFEARAVWQQVRAEVWSHPDRGLWPPVAATSYDGISAVTKEQRPHSPYVPNVFNPVTGRWSHVGDPVVWSVDRVREAVNADVASVLSFQIAKPEAATEIAGELDAYVEDLRTLGSIAEQYADNVDELGVPQVARKAWDDFEDRRRGR